MSQHLNNDPVAPSVFGKSNLSSWFPLLLDTSLLLNIYIVQVMRQLACLFE